MNENIDLDRKNKLFHLFNEETIHRIENTKALNFSHYTSAFAALEIIKTRRMWMRNSISMNDYSEIIYGKNCVISCWRDSDIGGRLKSALSKLHESIVVNIDNFLYESAPSREAWTFITSVSEYNNKDSYEATYGRLSMWRAYGGDTSVAIIFDTRPFILSNKSIDTSVMPVFYETPEEFKDRFNRMVLRIENNISFLKDFSIMKIYNILCRNFHYSMLSTKHPGFHEEREWRIVFSPHIDKPNNIECAIETINGVPQLLYKLDINKLISDSIESIELSRFIESVMIGPTANPFLIAGAFAHEISKFYTGNPYDKIKISEIPLRR